MQWAAWKEQLGNTILHVGISAALPGRSRKKIDRTIAKSVTVQSSDGLDGGTFGKAQERRPLVSESEHFEKCITIIQSRNTLLRSM